MMKKFLLSAVGACMMLALTACSSDDSDSDNTWFAMLPLVYHVVDTENLSVVSCKLSGAYTEMDLDNNTATLSASISLGEEEMVIEAVGLRVVQDQTLGGFTVSALGEIEASGHIVSGLKLHIDMRQSGTVRHFMTMTVDDRFEVNGLSSAMGFEVTQSEVTTTTGGSRLVSTGVYEFTITSLTASDMLADVSISGLNVFPLDNGIHYAGLKLQPTYEGYTITAAEPITPQEGGSSVLNSMEAFVNVHNRTFTAAYDVRGSATVIASGKMQ